MAPHHTERRVLAKHRYLAGFGLLPRFRISIYASPESDDR
jgi:hypothetical protein